MLWGHNPKVCDEIHQQVKEVLFYTVFTIVNNVCAAGYANQKKGVCRI